MNLSSPLTVLVLLLICSAFSFCRVLTFVISRYILRFGFRVMFVISRFYSIHFTVILART